MCIPWRSDERVLSPPFNQAMHYQQPKLYLSITSSVLSPAVSCETFGSSSALTLVAIGGSSISHPSQSSPLSTLKLYTIKPQHIQVGSHDCV